MTKIKNQKYFYIFSLRFWFFISNILFFMCFNAYCKEPYIYDNRGRRDPFIPLIGVASSALIALEDILSIEDIILQGIAFDSSGKKVAILNGEMVREGQTVGHLTLKKISKDKIVLTIGEDEYMLTIYGKEKPTKGG